MPSELQIEGKSCHLLLKTPGWLQLMGGSSQPAEAYKALGDLRCLLPQLHLPPAGTMVGLDTAYFLTHSSLRRRLVLSDWQAWE